MSGSIIGIPRELLPGERRVAATAESIKKLSARGFIFRVERGAGVLAGIDDQAYASAGAELVDSVWAEADAVLKVRPPTLDEVAQMKEGALLVALLQPERNPGLLDALRVRKITALALERVPRITRAQKMDVLSSMANLAGYRAVLEAAHHFQGPLGPQVTAAGTTPPARMLVIGAGVAGLAAIAAGRALGADVRAFDTRAAAREQVESLGARFIEVPVDESGEGAGGYARVMSPEFIAAEMALFRAQAKEVDIIVATALVPGAKAPLLLPRDVIDQLKPGSIVVDMAAEQGGNCELCVPGEIVEYRGVRILGFTDLTSRMAATASRFFAMNVVALLGELGAGDALDVDNESDIHRPALLLYRGEELPPPTPKAPAPPNSRAKTRPPPPDAKPLQRDVTLPPRRAWGSTLGGLVAISVLFLLGRFAPAEFLRHSTVFVLACFVGWQVIWSVQPSLHTPLMSVTNAISGIIVVGGLLQIGPSLDAASTLGLVAVFFATINITGGFLVTHRMLKMFRREESPAKAGHR